jgi:hypothetical protein
MRTLGLLVAGFFAYLAVVNLQTLDLQLNAILDRPPEGLPAGYPFHYPTSGRVVAATILVFGLSDVVVAFGGVALMAGAGWAPAITAGGLLAGFASQLASLATIEHSAPTVRVFGFVAALVGLPLVLALVTGWVPTMRGAKPEELSTEKMDEEHPPG